MLIALLLVPLSFLIFLMGVSPSVYGGDSGDIILASWFGGVAHPPGYPLQTMIGWVFTHLPYHASVAYKANLMAAFLMAVVISLTFLIIQKLTKNIPVAVVSALCLAFTPLFLLYAHIIEVFQLNLLLVSISVYFLILWRDSVFQKKETIKYLYFSITFLGLAVFHHHTAFLLFPAFFYLIRATNKKFLTLKNLLKTGLFFSLGVLPYIFIPIAALRQTPINWDDPSNLHNFIRLVTRADYGTFVAADFVFGSDIKFRFTQIAKLFLFLRADFKVLGLAFFSLGFVYSFLKDRTLFWFTFLGLFFTGPFFLFYASFPLANDFYTGLWERFILLPYFFVVFYIAYGFSFVFRELRNFIQKRNLFAFKASPNLGGLIITFFFILIPSYFLVANFYKTDLSKFYLGDWLGHDILISSDSGSLIILLGDTLTFNTEYVYYTDNDFKDRKIIRGGILNRKEYREQVVRQYKDLEIPDNFDGNDISESTKYLSLLISANINKFPIYTTYYTPNIDGYKWISAGMLKKLVRKDEFDKNKLVELNDEVISRFNFRDSSYNFGYEQYLTSNVKEIYYYSFIDIADELINHDFEDAAQKYLDNTVVLLPDKKEAYIRLGNIAFNHKECDKSKEYFEKEFALDKRAWEALNALSKLYGECYMNVDEAKKYSEAADSLKRELSGKPLDTY